jgi:hypothetical protein
MSALDTYLNELDNSTYDRDDIHLIQNKLKEIAGQLIEEGNFEEAKLADLNRQVFSVQKSFKYKESSENGQLNGMSWQIRGIKTFEDGSQEPYYWPDVEKFTTEDYQYFEKRYKESHTLFVKTEYGLMVYFGGKTDFSKHNSFKRELFTELFDLSKLYYNKVTVNSSYIVYYYNTLQLALGVASESKLEKEISDIINYIFTVVVTFDCKDEKSLRIVPNLSDILSSNYGIAKKYVDFRKVIDKNIEIAAELEKYDLYSTLSVVDRCLKMEQKLNGDRTYLIEYKGKIYEKLARESENRNSPAAVDFADKALRIYQQLDLKEDLNRLQNYYKNIRGKQKFSNFIQELSIEDTRKIHEQIDKFVRESTDSEIIRYFISTPWYRKIDDIKEMANESRKQSLLLSIAPAKIIDKFGNTVDLFITEMEREEYSFWQSYSLDFQMGSQIMCRFFIKAYEDKKLSYDSVMSYLESTWFNDDIPRDYNGQEVKIKPISTIKPGLSRIFQELDRFYNEESYECDFVTIIDSLTLKIESILRNICEKIGIPTFKASTKGGSELMMEKTLDVLLAEIAHKPDSNQITNFDEEDRIMIKFVLSEKAGLNLRNKVAHGLMDFNEYNFDLVVILFSLIMKLSKYTFIETKGGENESSNL